MPVQMHADEREAWLDDATSEIHLRWGGQDEDELLDPTLVRETAEAVLSPAFAEVERLREALVQTSKRIDQIQRDRRERDKVFGCCRTARAEIRRALDGI